MAFENVWVPWLLIHKDSFRTERDRRRSLWTLQCHRLLNTEEHRRRTGQSSSGGLWRNKVQ